MVHIRISFFRLTCIYPHNDRLSLSLENCKLQWWSFSSSTAHPFPPHTPHVVGVFFFMPSQYHDTVLHSFLIPLIPFFCACLSLSAVRPVAWPILAFPSSFPSFSNYFSLLLLLLLRQRTDPVRATARCSILGGRDEPRVDDESPFTYPYVLAPVRSCDPVAIWWHWWGCEGLRY